jgi:hypothetical protein
MLPTLGMRRGIKRGEVPMKKLNKSRDQLLTELRSAYERGASIRTLVASTGRSYGSIHSMLRESGTTMRSRGGPNHRSRRAS